MNRSRLAALTAGAVLLVATVLVPATALAAGNNIVVLPATTTISPAGSVGGSFTVTVAANSDVAISGAGAALQFDSTKLALTDIARDPTLFANGAGFAGFPSAANKTQFIADANAAGLIPTIAWAYQDGSSAEAAGANHGIFQATFSVIAAGDSNLLPVIVTGVGGLLDGRTATYGESLDPIAVASGAVVNTAPPTPEPTPTPTPTPTPPNSQVTDVTGTMDAGYVALTCPTQVTIPLARNATNQRVITCTVYSNIIWTLNANDTNTDPLTRGRMRDGTKVLANPMHVLSGLRIVNGEPVYDYDQNLANGGIVSAGANTVPVQLTLAQFVAPQDQPGNYGIQVVFSAVSGF